MNCRTYALRALAAGMLGSAVVIATSGQAIAETDAGVSALSNAIPKIDIAGTYAPFVYTSPTLGCGSNGPFTFTAASDAGGTAGNVGHGQIRLQGTPAYSGAPMASGLVIAWLNVTTGANGVVPVDDTDSNGTPTLGRVVDSGSGTVVASMAGSVTYNDAICHVAPTVGVFTVAR
ncbi:hypothetical protein [Antrihabitans cavernicola]|uniref:Uncharacterized protein n=1 Tax=Antrihabitans cavernicola TaxID=2495913 RepID=A0A5A7SCP3_9NOCA|nr:hypothetical protein [Spelaeibacter cavernicola]KAA0022507.1 hypothetical protein FOY51_12450 [Spelaeibacter cavernicola]